jgi:hypothetical protein
MVGKSETFSNQPHTLSLVLVFIPNLVMVEKVLLETSAACLTKFGTNTYILPHRPYVLSKPARKAYAPQTPRPDA